MRSMRATITLATAVILLAGCTLLDRSSSNSACEAVGSAKVSDALDREIEAKPSPIESGFYSCNYFLHSPRQVLARLSLYEEEASRHFDSDRADYGEAPGGEILDEDLGMPAYLSVDPNVALAGALDGDRYFIVDIFVDRYGETPEAAGEAAVRLLQAAVDAED
jgi:hypothetical protein